MAGFIEYSGVFKDFEFLNDFIEEVEDISKIMNWEFEIQDDNDLKGLSVTPTNCDTLHFTINEAGLITKPWVRKFPNHGNIKVIKVEINVDDDEIKPKISEGNPLEIKENINKDAHLLIIKTAFENEEEDQKLVSFMEYIGNKYFNDFQLDFSPIDADESEEIMNFNPIEMIHSIFAKFAEKLDKNDIKPNENIFDFIKRIMKDKDME
ncbi:MAG: hypothetical protein ACOVQ2_01480 [Flavobacterium sp.]